jgi:hypothetical protein
MLNEIAITEKEILQLPNDTELGKYVREKFYHTQFINENSYDKCVICGKESPYTEKTNIELRVGYVEGVGQTCFQPNFCG